VQTFLTFLKKVLEVYPTGTISVILDNARIHHAKLLQDFLSDNKRLTFVILLAYSPQQSVVEGLWKWLKSDVVNNAFYHTAAQIRKNVHAFIEPTMKGRSKIIDRLCIRMESGVIVENLYVGKFDYNPEMSIRAV